MALYIEPGDITPFADIEPGRLAAMIEDAEAQAVMVAPCLETPSDLSPMQQAAVKAVLRAAILRWNDAGSGAITQQTAGPFSVTQDTRQSRRGAFWPSEISDLQRICSQVGGADSAKAWNISVGPAGVGAVHVPWCSTAWGASCSCGADIAGFPIYEV